MHSHSGATRRGLAISAIALGLGLLLSEQAAFAGDAINNPFHGTRPFVSPQYQMKIRDTAARFPDIAQKLASIQNVGTAMWVTAIQHVPYVGEMLNEAEAQAAASGQQVVATVVVYDLPERDCAAAASAGELTVDNGGPARYQAEFIDPVAAAFRAHPSIRVAVVLEPDSLANLATNLQIPKCARAAPVYVDLVAYALRAFNSPNVSVYLDAAHGGWLGWDENRRRAAEVYRDVIDAAGPNTRLRGFALNVSNYSPLHASEPDPLGEGYYQYNPAHDELTYAALFQQNLAALGVAERDVIIDTGRNGNPLARTSWSSWCNVRGAGLGERPRAEPQAGVDAYVWIKPPGESDGEGVYSDCSGPDNFPGAPPAGEWFFDHFAEMVRRAEPAL